MLELQNISLKISHTLSLLEDISKQDVISWADNFKIVATSNNWDETTSKVVLQSVITPTILSHLNLTTSTEDILNQLLHLKYPLSDSSKYSWKLKNISQDNFTSIKDYLNLNRWI